MVNYMWGKDVADVLDGPDDAPKIDDARAAGAARSFPAEPNDEYNFYVSAADIYKSIDRRIDRLYRMAAGLPLDNPQTTL